MHHRLNPAHNLAQQHAIRCQWQMMTMLLNRRQWNHHGRIRHKLPDLRPGHFGKQHECKSFYENSGNAIETIIRINFIS
jgi:hypothetical protein